MAHDARDAASAAADGLFRGNSAAARRRWSWSRPCSPAPQTSSDLAEALEVRFLANRDAQPAFRPADGLSGRATRKRCRRTRRCCSSREEASRSSTKVRRCVERRAGDAADEPATATGSVLPVPSPATLESARAGLDGLRAQARQARRPECASARQRANAFLARRRQYGGACRREVRHHARHRHATAARLRAAVRRCDGASAESSALRRRGGDRGRAGDRRLRHSATARRGEPARHQPVAVRAAASAASPASIRIREPSPTSIRTCSAKARSSARASTTSMPSSARSTDRLPENRILSHDLLEGCYARSGLVERRAAVRGVIRPATARTSVGGIAGFAATGRSPAGSCRASPALDARRHRNPLSALSRWKIFDNLRRSLVPAALTLLLLLGWIGAAAPAGSGP